jgi:endonuclease/exonuclease/phosphatase family metal-dependent hydrolase
LRRVAAALLVGAVALAIGCASDPEFRPDRQHLHRVDAALPVPMSPPDSLLVVSYNVQYGEDVGLAIADLRRAGLVRPDVLLLQEMTPAGVDSVARALGLHARYQPAAIHPHHDRRFGNAVLTRWPILGTRLLVLPHGHPVTGDRRIALACDLDVAGHEVRVVSVHLATVIVDADARLEQALAVVDSLVVGGPERTIVGGDFNTGLPGDVARLRRLYRRSVDLHPANLGRGCTVRWHPGRLLGGACLLDHVFARGLEPRVAGISRSAVASDHYPIWAWLQWSAGSSSASF